MNNKECPDQAVILLHGLARSRHSMQPMANALERQGLITENVDYPSRKWSIEKLAEMAIAPTIDACRKRGVESIHFVTHSLGGILVRQFASNHPADLIGRVVMLGPPNQGTEAVDYLKNLPGFRLLNGPAGSEIGTAADDLPVRLGAVDFELGVIAGTRSFNPLISSILPGADDGKVAASRTRIEGMSDFIELPVNHTFMMRNGEAIRQTIHFLRYGEFDR